MMEQSSTPALRSAGALHGGWRQVWVERLRRPAVAECLLLLGVFVATRVALYAAGLRLNLDLSWMFLSDMPDLRSHLLRTVYYFHAFAPGMDLLTGVLLKLAPEHVAQLASLIFAAFGYLLLVSATGCSRALGFSSWPARGIGLALSLLPQSLYFENLYLYTYLCTALLCWAALRFQRALLQRSALSWLAFFLPCAVLGWFYTTFHLFWLLLCIGLSWALAAGARRQVLRGALLPALLLFALYFKNYVVFGVFGATSWAGGNVALSTTQQMDPTLREQWIAEGKLSPYAAINVFAPPGDYLRFFSDDVQYPWPGTNELWRDSVNAGNFNHGLFLEVNKERGADAAYFIAHNPRDYLRVVLGKNLPAFFNSSTHWHPHDNRPVSAHSEHRKVLGGYERAYDRLFHRWPVRRFGLYTFLPIFLVWGALRCVRDLRSPEPELRAAGALLGFCLMQIGFISTVSILFSAFETARYRYTIEPCIWFVVASGLRAAYLKLRRVPEAAASVSGTARSSD